MMHFFLLLLSLFSSTMYAAGKKIGPKKPTCVLIENGPFSATANNFKQRSKSTAWKPIKGDSKKRRAYQLRLKKDELDALRTTLTGNDILLTIAYDDRPTESDYVIHSGEAHLEVTVSQNTRPFVIHSKHIPKAWKQPSKQNIRMEKVIQEIIGTKNTHRIIAPQKKWELLLVDNLTEPEALFIGALLKAKYLKQKTHKIKHFPNETKTIDSKNKIAIICENVRELLRSMTEHH